MQARNSNDLNNSEQIKIICKRQKITLSSVAEALGISKQNFSNKLSRNNFEESELRTIASIINCEYHSYFVFKE